jgi:uncharacterized Tic20 family protein
MMNPSPTTEERIWAVIAHLSALAFGLGLVLPVIGWSDQRNKSRYATFQCLQAFGYQSLGYTIWLLTYIVLVTLLTIVFVIVMPGAGNDNFFIAAWGGIFLLVIFGLLGLYMLLPVIAAIACGFGRDFQYPILGKRLARYLEYGNETAGLNDEHQERWAAAMGHFSVIILFWGLLAPVATWILQRRQNTFLRFQSIQTTIYQAIVNLIYIGATMLSFAGMIPLFLWAAFQGNSSSNSTFFMLGPILFFILLLITFPIMLIIPLFHILGQWAGYRVLKGDNYRYPIIGKMVEKRLAKSYGVRKPAPASSGRSLDSQEENS